MKRSSISSTKVESIGFYLNNLANSSQKDINQAGEAIGILDRQISLIMKFLRVLGTGGVGEVLTARGAGIDPSFQPPSGRFIDRGDPGTPDFDDTTMTVDGSWYPLDLSPIVPNGAVAVLIRATVWNDTAFVLLSLRKKGNVSDYNSGSIFGGSDIPSCGDLIVACDSDRAIEYMAMDFGGGSNWIMLTVGGWLMGS